MEAGGDSGNDEDRALAYKPIRVRWYSRLGIPLNDLERHCEKFKYYYLFV